MVAGCGSGLVMSGEGRTGVRNVGGETPRPWLIVESCVHWTVPARDGSEQSGAAPAGGVGDWENRSPTDCEKQTPVQKIISSDGNSFRIIVGGLCALRNTASCNLACCIPIVPCDLYNRR